MTKHFPRAESDIATLTGRVIDGLTNAAEDFPAPPGETRDITIVSEGDTWAILQWKPPGRIWDCSGSGSLTVPCITTLMHI